MTSIPLPIASRQEGDHPRPQLLRERWTDLTGPWDFALGAPEAAPGDVVFDRTILVPFPPESTASGLGEEGRIHSVWYRRTFGRQELQAAGLSEEGRLLLHFGAVDWEATVWVNGVTVATHRGGQSPFSADVTHALRADGDNEIVVHAVDDPEDVSILRGKQDWREQPHAIWYHRTTGIWQPVWLEVVPKTSVAALTWSTDIPSAGVELDVEIAGEIDDETWLHVELFHEGELLSETRTRVLSRFESARMRLPRQTNGQQHEELLWSPEHPTLIDATVRLETRSSADAVASYFGIRSVAAVGAAFLLNDRPVKLRAVLAQNYWPQSHLAAPSAAALRREVELIRELGFNTARVHQKAEDPRFLYWADRLGLMVWAETANAYAFDRRAASTLMTEWMSLVERDTSHPSVIVWVPLNESWGVQHIAHDERQRALSRSVSDMTRALDGTRPVISNDGWEHTDSDIWTIHDYEADPAVLAERYGSIAAVEAMIHGFGPAGRRIAVDADRGRKPVMLTEFGGVSLRPDNGQDWGYSTAETPADFGDRVCGLIRAADGAAPLSGFCYTQLTDTGQETNGLLYDDRTPKVPIADIRAAVLGE
ncbi:glycoside hydrolase family 2 TIM barrel-domain containing protein [Microbacterium sp. 10M-3C3]|uniref:glycoside hydrolase family 2 TIM barrel-domain containing protein n=1 Tax=Microbacterium sp. 10M-3C3 TaxID=2483401 RepID=UPI000F6446FA|nr:glycoside hydrolase family 2 TIM barrel-domain containing protein [Microbacterium sp. 10M-3C3]